MNESQVDFDGGVINSFVKVAKLLEGLVERTILVTFQLLQDCLGVIVHFLVKLLTHCLVHFVSGYFLIVRT